MRKTNIFLPTERKRFFEISHHFHLIFLLFFRDVCLDYTLMMHLKLLTICQHFHFLNYWFTDLSFEIHETTHFKTMYSPRMCLFPRNHSLSYSSCFDGVEYNSIMIRTSLSPWFCSVDQVWVALQLSVIWFATRYSF